MPNFKCSVGFRVKDAGWSETYYLSASDHNAAMTTFQALVLKRIGLNTPDVATTFLRVSNTDHRRDSLLQFPPTALLVGTYAVSGEAPTCNLAQDAFLVDLVADPATKNKKFLRGLTDSLFTSGGVVLSAGFTTAINAYANQLVNDLWRVKTVTVDGAIFTTSYSVITLVINRGATTRRVGRPFGLRPGRRKTTRRGLIRVVRRARSSGLVSQADITFA